MVNRRRIHAQYLPRHRHLPLLCPRPIPLLHQSHLQPILIRPRPLVLFGIKEDWIWYPALDLIDHRIVIDSASRSLFIGTQKATYELCSSTTLMVTHGELDSGQVLPGNSFCMKTSADRYAGVRVVGLNGDVTTIDITVWDPPDP